MNAGILERDGGEVSVDGRTLTTRSPQARSAIGLVPQDLAIYPDLTTRENLRFFGHLYGMNGARLKERIAQVLDVVGLAERADDKSKEFSGGMKRRLNIGIGCCTSLGCSSWTRRGDRGALGSGNPDRGSRLRSGRDGTTFAPSVRAHSWV